METEWHWQGASGVWYKHAVVNLAGPLLAVPANYIAVRRGQDGTRLAIHIGETEDLGRSWRDHASSGLLADALELGVNEVHLYFGGRDKAERSAIETDLRSAQCAPLDDRPVLASALSSMSNLAASSHAPPSGWGDFDQIVALANMLNARSAATGRQTPLQG